MRKISIDLDGVVADYIHTFLNELNSRLGTKYKRSDITHYLLEKCLNIPTKLVEDIVEYHKDTKEWEQLKPITGAKFYLKKLYDNGYQITFVTRRRRSLREQTENWLNNNNIKYKSLIMVRCPKGVYINKDNTDYFIDDEPHQIESVLDGKVVPIIFDQRYNKDYTRKGVLRANNWKDVYNIVTGKK